VDDQRFADELTQDVHVAGDVGRRHVVADRAAAVSAGGYCGQSSMLRKQRSGGLRAIPRG